MDGLLINSEVIYTEVTNTILRENGRPDIPWSIKAHQTSSLDRANCSRPDAISSLAKQDSPKAYTVHDAFV